jgi:hypothetical protein
MLTRDMKELIRAFNDSGVKYLLAGGFAYGVHAEPRATKDLHLFIPAEVPNRDAVFRALCKDGEPLKGLTAQDFRDTETDFQTGVPPNRIDILQKIDGVSFDQAWKNHVDALIEGDTLAYVISREDLIRNQLASGRPRDLLDVEQIRKAALYAPSAAQGSGKRPGKKRRPNTSGH